MSEGALVWTRALLYVGALVAMGRALQALRHEHWRSAAGTIHQTRAIRALAWFGIIALIAAPTLLLRSQMMALEMTWRDLPSLINETGWGRGFRILAVSTVATAIVLPLRMTRRNAWLLTVLAAAVAIAMGGLGHAASDMRWPIGARVLDAAHVLSIGAWIGGLLVTWLATRQPGFYSPEAAWRDFSGLATIMAPLAVLTGLASGARILVGHAPAVIVNSPYGQMLIVKSIMVAIVLAIGARQRTRIARGQLAAGRSVVIELGMAAWVLLVTATLTGTAPPGE
ncbi:MAG: CopD family protein [Gemmatimonadaceae bacterium]|nr:CopD family protein [Gemmatimonadaceae bacterium]